MLKLSLPRLLFATCLFFDHSSLATPARRDSSNSISCDKWTIPVAASADNLIFDAPLVDSNIDAANYAWYQDSWFTPNLTVRTHSVLHVNQTIREWLGALRSPDLDHVVW